MLSDKNVFLKNKIIEINTALTIEGSDMFELIGEVKDLFSSPYNTGTVANCEVVQELWGALFNVFSSDSSYDNKFEAIFTMSDIAIYARKQGVKVGFELLEEWRSAHGQNDTTVEILECIDDILL
ncbi:hypothetical protein AB1E22_01130 [Buttiauxella gaviniae]|uniref:Uncharacterized protein n=1 Tax=Buttiauxella gaviniae TaxID=82990 RepID=A0ABV3NP91_9ENTR